MLAVIENSASPGVALMPIAGRPLIIRQLQWLRANGLDQVGVELSTGAGAQEVARCVSGNPLGWDVLPVQTRGPVGAHELARRAGFGADVPVLAIPGDVLGECDLAQIYMVAASLAAERASGRTLDLVVRLPAPTFLSGDVPGAALRLLRGAHANGPTVVVSGWGTRITCAGDAIRLGAAMLEKRATGGGLLLHASERSPGVWVARGGVIHAHADVTPPVLVGAGAIIRSGAHVGPRVFLGERAVVERDAVLSDAIIAAETIVGEKLVARDAYVTPSGVCNAERGGVFQRVEDPLILTHRHRPVWS